MWNRTKTARKRCPRQWRDPTLVLNGHYRCRSGRRCRRAMVTIRTGRGRRTERAGRGSATYKTGTNRDADDSSAHSSRSGTTRWTDLSSSAAIGERDHEPGRRLLERGYDGDCSFSNRQACVRRRARRAGVARGSLSPVIRPASRPDQGATPSETHVLDALDEYDDTARGALTTSSARAYATVTMVNARTRRRTSSRKTTITVDRRFLPEEDVRRR